MAELTGQRASGVTVNIEGGVHIENQTILNGDSRIADSTDEDDVDASDTEGSQAELDDVQTTFSGFPDYRKWVLASDTVVEDVMHAALQKYQDF
jgi:hypothetical protein